MGNRMKQYRLGLKMSQEELEAKSGISRATISAIENDPAYNTTTKTLERLATALGTTVDQIFFG